MRASDCGDRIAGIISCLFPESLPKAAGLDWNPSDWNPSDWNPSDWNPSDWVRGPVDLVPSLFFSFRAFSGVVIFFFLAFDPGFR
ncbi:hypothetical protein OAL43_01290 [bacterium]|nr:hypothetical protein [bacterium]